MIIIRLLDEINGMNFSPLFLKHTCDWKYEHWTRPGLHNFPLYPNRFINLMSTTSTSLKELEKNFSRANQCSGFFPSHSRVQVLWKTGRGENLVLFRVKAMFWILSIYTGNTFCKSRFGVLLKLTYICLPFLEYPFLWATLGCNLHSSPNCAFIGFSVFECVFQGHG